MDMITTAIVAALSKLAEPTIKDSYEALKRIISERFGRNSNVVEAIEKVEQNPTSVPRKEVLREEIASANLEKDEEIIKFAKAILEHVKGDDYRNAQIHQVVTQQSTGDHNVSTGVGNITISKN